ncbi:hypothetical protein BamMEX5DRAFT_7117 [Burkholderia ambifaria MEX-5]|uniref:Uncharacterized protein n=1 Tax=Burkholderia ambifaria MEX-5 TaxID=396597 RepID=B1TH50_9BURK|nr:hypothetical protein BamMEX5DRAFT_7117 [Burkholderia ambifaria MEX-5]
MIAGIGYRADSNYPRITVIVAHTNRDLILRCYLIVHVKFFPGITMVASTDSYGVVNERVIPVVMIGVSRGYPVFIKVLDISQNGMVVVIPHMYIPRPHAIVLAIDKKECCVSTIRSVVPDHVCRILNNVKPLTIGRFYGCLIPVNCLFDESMDRGIPCRLFTGISARNNIAAGNRADALRRPVERIILPYRDIFLIDYMPLLDKEAGSMRNNVKIINPRP